MKKIAISMWWVALFCLFIVPAAFADIEDGSDERGEITKEKWEQMQRRIDALEERTQDLSVAEKSIEERIEELWVAEKEVERRLGPNVFDISVHGRVHTDFAAFREDDVIKEEIGESKKGIILRRTRLTVDNMLYSYVTSRIDVELAQGEVQVRDAWLGVPILSNGRLRVGHFREPFGLNELNSSNILTFIERASTNVFDPDRNMGAMIEQAVLNNRMIWTVGAFIEANIEGKSLTGDGLAITSRVTGLPYYIDDGRRLVHLGADYSYRSPEQDNIRFRRRLDSEVTAVRYVDTGDVSAKSVHQVNGEAAVVWGPTSLQGEYRIAQVNGVVREDPDPLFQGGYIFVSYLLTGEHRLYSQKGGQFVGVQPKRNFGADGPGAWELAARYASIDLTDAGVLGGDLSNVTVGLNWYLNRNTRMMFNYVHGWRDPGPDQPVGEADAFETRFAFFF